jgi:hypothetical protein
VLWLKSIRADRIVELEGLDVDAQVFIACSTKASYRESDAEGLQYTYSVLTMFVALEKHDTGRGLELSKS